MATKKKDVIIKPFPVPRMIDARSGIGKAIRRAGSVSKFANAIGVSHQAASRWHDRGFVPPGRVEQVSGLYDIPKVELVSPKLAALLAPDEDVDFA